jgi:foldase protein PrsA
MVSRRTVAWILVLFVLAALPAAAGHKDEPDKVVVQHILIGFKKSVPNKKLDRKREQARVLALDLFRRAQEGEDFDALVKEYTDDTYPGILLLTNEDAPVLPEATKRSDVVPRFGDVSFELEIGEVGLAKYHAALSPFGWHIIKRLE